MAANTIAVRKLYVQIRPQSVIITPNDPTIDSSPPSIPLALLVIDPSPDARTLSMSLTYIYGSEPGDYVGCQFQNVDVLELLSACPGQTVMEKINLRFMALTAEARNNLIRPTLPSLGLGVRYPGQTDNEQFINAFLVGMTAHLMAVCLFKHTDDVINHPFYPIETEFPPVEGTPQQLLTQCIGDYMAIYARILQAMIRGYTNNSPNNNMKHHMLDKVGATWLTIVDLFWQAFADCFPLGCPEGSSVINSALHSALVGYSKHQEMRCEMLSAQFNNMEQNTQQVINDLNQLGESTMQNVTQNVGRVMSEQEAQTNRVLNNISSILQQNQQQITEQAGQMGNMAEEYKQFVQASQSQNISQLQAVTNDCVGKIDARLLQGMEDSINNVQKFIDESVARNLQSSQSLSQMSDGITNELITVQQGSVENIVKVHNDSMTKMMTTMEEFKAELILLSSDGKDRVNVEGQKALQNLNEKREGEIKAMGVHGQDICQNMSDIERKILEKHEEATKRLQGEIGRIILECKEIVADEARTVAGQCIRQSVDGTLPGIKDEVQSVVKGVIDGYLQPHIQKVQRDVAEGLRQCNMASSLVQKLETYGQLQGVKTPNENDLMNNVLQRLVYLEQGTNGKVNNGKVKDEYTTHLEQRVRTLEQDLDKATKLIYGLSHKFHDFCNVPDEAMGPFSPGAMEPQNSAYSTASDYSDRY